MEKYHIKEIMDKYNLEKYRLKFQPYKIFNLNKQRYLFDGENVSLYRIDDTVLKILGQQGKTAIAAYNTIEKNIDEKIFWDTLHKMKESGFIIRDEDKHQIEKIPQIKGITLMLIQECNLACEYCFGSEGEYADRGKMQRKIAIDSIDYLIKNSGDAKELNITFFGGEPLLCFDLIQEIVKYCKEKEQIYGKRVTYNMTTNGTLLNDEINKFIIENNISTMISIDGNRNQQNAKRYYKSKKGCYDEVIEKTKNLREKNYLSARATITASNIKLVEVFEHLYSLGFRNIPMSPAYNLLSDRDYKQYIFELNRLCEHFEQLLKSDIRKAKTIRMLWKAIKRIHKGAGQHTACGAGSNGVAIDIHGNIYPCHRFVSNKEFILNNIYSNEDNRKKYVNKIGIENYNKCKNCYLRLLCGGGCSYENYIETGDINSIFEKQCIETQTLYSNLIKTYALLNEEEKKIIFST